MRRGRELLIALVCVCACAVPASAQQTPPQAEEPTSVYGLVGLLSQQVLRTAPVPGPQNLPGPTLGFQFRTSRAGQLGWVFELMAQTRPAQDRHVNGLAAYNDAVAPFYMLVGAEFGRGRYVRVSGGVTTIDNVAPMAGVALGFETTHARTLSGAELVVRVGGRRNALGVLVGVQLRVGGYARAN